MFAKNALKNKFWFIKNKYYLCKTKNKECQ